MKKIFMSPWFTPVMFILLWLGFQGAVYLASAGDVLSMTAEGGIIEGFTHFGYVLLIGVMLMVCNDYKDRIMTWGICLFLALCSLLREWGIQHHLSRTDTTPFKSRFFLNPENPLGEKIVFGLVLLIVAGAVGYLACKYSKHLVRSFLEFNPVTWSVATMCTVGVCAKIVDRFPANWRKAHGGVRLSDDVYAVFQLAEESSEMFLPYIAIVILYQFRLQQRAGEK